MGDFISSMIQGFVEDSAIDYGQEYAHEHFQPTKDPFYDKRTGKRLKLPEYITDKKVRRSWKSLQDKAWMHDKSMCGCCCWTNTIGWAPLLSILPVIGPMCMYLVHKKLIDFAEKKFHLPEELVIKMHGNIALDLTISMVPVLGAVFAWLHACSTRNCAMVYNYLVRRNLPQMQTQTHDDVSYLPPQIQKNVPARPQPSYQLEHIR